MTQIAKLRLGHIQYDEGRPPVTWGAHRFARSALVAQVISVDDTVGAALVWCRVANGTAYNRAAIDSLKEALLKQRALSPYELGRLCQQAVSRNGLSNAAHVVELALLDLEGRRLSVPCHQLLGSKRLSVPAYAISIQEFAFSDDAQFVDLAESYVEQGFGAAKFHLTGNPSRDIAICRAIRSAVGDEMTLMLDPAGRYDRASALRVGLAIEELGYARFEDPLAPHDFAGYRWLSQRLKIPIAANDPMQWSVRDCIKVASEGIVQCLRIDPGRAGVSAVLKASAITAANSIEIDFSALAPGGGVEACLHFALSSETAMWFERHFADGIDEVPGITSGIELTNGRATPSDEPGWGMTIDWKELDRFCEWIE